MDSHHAVWHWPCTTLCSIDGTIGARARHTCGYRLWKDNDEGESDYEGAGTVDEAIVVVVFVAVIVTVIVIALAPRVAGVVCGYLTCLANCLVLSSAKGNVDTGVGFGATQW